MLAVFIVQRAAEQTFLSGEAAKLGPGSTSLNALSNFEAETGHSGSACCVIHVCPPLSSQAILTFSQPGCRRSPPKLQDDSDAL